MEIDGGRLEKLNFAGVCSDWGIEVRALGYKNIMVLMFLSFYLLLFILLKLIKCIGKFWQQKVVS